MNKPLNRMFKTQLQDLKLNLESQEQRQLQIEGRVGIPLVEQPPARGKLLDIRQKIAEVQTELRRRQSKTNRRFKD